jgi:hypothetical protein
MVPAFLLLVVFSAAPRDRWAAHPVSLTAPGGSSGSGLASSAQMVIENGRLVLSLMAEGGKTNSSASRGQEAQVVEERATM